MAISVKELMASAGMTALAESFTGNKISDRPGKKFNAERYFAAKESIARVEAGFKGEVYEMQAKIKRWAAAGEDVDEIKRKISNGATDAWRKVKELIGKLLVMVEELFAGFMSKRSALDKMATSLERKTSDIKTLLRSSLLNNVDVEENFSVELPSEIGGKKVNVLFQTKLKAGDYISQVGQELESVGKAEDAIAFCKAISNKNLYKLILQDSQALSGATGVSRVTGTKGNPLGTGATDLKNLVTMVGEYLGKIEAKKMKIKALKAGNISTDTYKVTDTASLKNFLDGLAYAEQIVYECAVRAGKNIAQLGNHIKDSKMMLNKIKNAPVKITKTSKKSQENLQLVRLYCTRGAKGLNLIRTSYNAEASYLIILGSKLIKAQEKTLKYVTNDANDDSIKVRTFGKNTYK